MRGKRMSEIEREVGGNERNCRVQKSTTRDGE